MSGAPGGKGLFADAVVLQGAQAANILLSVATFWILGRALSTADYGVYSLIIALVSYLFVLAASWSSQGFVRFAREEFVRQGTLGAAGRARGLIVGVAAFTCLAPLLLFRDRLFAFVGVAPAWVWLVVALFALQVAGDVLGGAFQAVTDFRSLAVYQTVDKGASLVALGAAWAIPGGLTVFRVGLALVLGKAVAVCLLLPRLRLDWLRAEARDAPALRPLWAYTSPLLVSAVVGYLPLFAGPYIVNYYLNPSEVAKYNVAYQLYGFYQAMTTSVIATLLVPLFTDLVAGGRSDTVRRVAGRLQGQLVVLNYLAVAGLSTLSVFGLPLALPRYRDSVPALVLLLAGTCWQVVLNVYSALLAAYRVSRPVAVINILGGVLFLGLYALLIPRWGILALSGVWVAWYAVSTPMYLYYVRGQGARVAWSDLGPALVGSIALLAILVPASAVGRGAVALGGVPVVLLVARARGWFRAEDLSFAERIGLPATLRRAVVFFYRVMDAGHGIRGAVGAAAEVPEVRR